VKIWGFWGRALFVGGAGAHVLEIIYVVMLTVSLKYKNTSDKINWPLCYIQKQIELLNTFFCNPLLQGFDNNLY